MDYGSEGLFEEQIPEAFCSGHISWTGGPFVSKLAKMSESIKENDRMRVMMAFLPHLLSIKTLSLCLFSFTSSDEFNDWVKMCWHSADNSHFTLNIFRPCWDVIKWPTDNIG